MPCQEVKKDGSGWLFPYDTWLRYLEKMQFMVTETCQISSWRSEDVSEEILSHLVRKDVAEFSDVFLFPVCNSRNV